MTTNYRKNLTPSSLATRPPPFCIKQTAAPCSFYPYPDSQSGQLLLEKKNQTKIHSQKQSLCPREQTSRISALKLSEDSLSAAIALPKAISQDSLPEAIALPKGVMPRISASKLSKAQGDEHQVSSPNSMKIKYLPDAYQHPSA